MDRPNKTIESLERIRRATEQFVDSPAREVLDAFNKQNEVIALPCGDAWYALRKFGEYLSSRPPF